MSGIRKEYFLLKCIPTICKNNYRVEGNASGGGPYIYEGEKTRGHDIKVTRTNILHSIKSISIWKNIYLPIT